MKRFRIEDEFLAPVDRVEAFVLSPELYPRLERAMPAIASIEPLERVEEGGRVRRRVRYTPNTEGKIPAFGRGVVSAQMLAWVEESTFDRATRRFDYTITPNLPPAWRDRFASHGSYTLAPSGAGTRRVIEGEISVRIPLLGGTVEKLILREVETNFRAEARALAAWLSE